MSRSAKIIWVVIISLILLCLYSCAPIKRLHRFEKRHPYLFEHIKDTVVIHDTVSIKIPGTSIDTTFSTADLRNDTVYIYKEGIHTTIYISNDTLNLYTKTDPIDSLIPTESKVIVDKYEPMPIPESNNMTWPHSLLKSLLVLFIVAIGIVLLLLIIRLFFALFKRK